MKTIVAASLLLLQDFSPDALLKKLQSGNAEERAAALAAAKQWRGQMAPKLVEMASEPETEKKHNWSKRAAIELLGELRDESACAVFVREIDLRPSPFEEGPIGGKATLYPCAKALVRIGVPAAAEILSAVKAGKDLSELKMALFANALARIYGAPEIASCAVELESKKTAEGKANLAKLLERLKPKR